MRRRRVWRRRAERTEVVEPLVELDALCAHVAEVLDEEPIAPVGARGQPAAVGLHVLAHDGLFAAAVVVLDALQLRSGTARTFRVL